MYLINAYSLQLKYFVDLDDPGRRPFAALSHRWGSSEEELTFQEIETEVYLRPISVKNKPGYKKLREAARTAKEENLEWIWVDTCCIDKKSSAELQESINSMWRIYSTAALCMVYMNDTTESFEDEHELPPWQESSKPISKTSFEQSQWFTRGWTLQELLAPENIIFYSHDWQAFGTRSSLQDTISSITTIPKQCLDSDKNRTREAQIRSYSAATIMSWAASRRTKRPEDRAYSLLGIFDVQMPLLYGEGDRAFQRLQMEIAKMNNDPTLFLWHPPPADGMVRSGKLLARSPADFTISLMCERPPLLSFPWTTPSTGVSSVSSVTFINGIKWFACMSLGMPPLNAEQVHTIRHNGHTIYQLQQIHRRECIAVPQDLTSNVDWTQWSVHCALWIYVVWLSPGTEAYNVMKAHRMWPMFFAQKKLKDPKPRWWTRNTRDVRWEQYEVILTDADRAFPENHIACMPIRQS